MKKYLIALFFAGAILLVSCSPTAQQASAGSSSETVIGKITNADGSPAQKTKVLLIPADYDPALQSQPGGRIIVVDSTDEIGAYRIQVSDTGQYNLMAVQTVLGTRCLVQGIALTGIYQDSFQVRQCSLAVPGAIKVILVPGLDTTNGYVYVAGTTLMTSLGHASGSIILDSVPQGIIHAIYSGSKSGGAAASKIIDSIAVLSGDTAITTYSAWKFSKRCYLNTTASGAGVSGSVVHFPLIIRLSSANFDFSQARKNGEDLRFTKADGSLCAFEIERWDSAGSAAEIWVSVDTVYGNDNTHYVKMLWGNPLASAASRSASVFDTAAGFQGVWHLAEPDLAIVKDATPNHFDGTPSNTAPTAAAGEIGIAKSFDGISSFFDMKNTASGKLNFAENAVYTVSAWAYADTLDNKFHTIVGKSDNQYFLKLKQYYPPNPMRWEFTEYVANVGWSITDTVATAREWKYLVGVRQGTNQYFYLDGVLVDTSIEIKTDSLARNTGDDVTIGKFLTYSSIDGSYCPFAGKIDEVRISNVARSPDWVRLCFMNQKTSDALVQFRQN